MKKIFLLLCVLGLLISCKSDQKQPVLVKKSTGDVVFFDTKDILDVQAQALFQEGLDLVVVEAYGQALDKFNAADALEPNNPTIITSIGTAQFRLGSIEASFEILESVLDIDETYLPAYVNLGVHYNRLQMPYDGIDILEQGLAYVHYFDRETVITLYLNLSVCYLNTQNCDSAFKYAHLAFDIAIQEAFKNTALRLIQAIDDQCDEE